MTTFNREQAELWANRELERDEHGNRIPRLADCDWAKEHLRRALEEIDRLKRDRQMFKEASMPFRQGAIATVAPPASDELRYIAGTIAGQDITLLRAAGQRVHVFAERVEPQPPNLPAGLVLVVLPQNCYIDPNWPNGKDM